MKRKVRLWQFMGFAVTSFLGTLLHFLYDWTGGAVWAAPISGVNESTWEHMKLLFFPMLLFAVVQSFFFRGRENFWCVKRSGILLGLVLIPVLFYTYNGVIGPSPNFVNIAIFFVSAAIAYLYETKRLLGRDTPCIPALAISSLVVLAVLFVVFTFRTPTIPLFRDPITGGYGI